MRIALATTALLVLGACNVNRDEQNDTTTVEFNEEAAQNGLATAANTAENVAEDAANEAQEIGAAVQNEVGDVDVDVDVNRSNAQ